LQRSINQPGGSSLMASCDPCGQCVDWQSNFCMVVEASLSLNLAAGCGALTLGAPSVSEKGCIGVNKYNQIQIKVSTRTLRQALPLALEESFWGATARSVTFVVTIREVEKMSPSSNVPAIPNQLRAD
jgi:hypothetical protein